MQGSFVYCLFIIWCPIAQINKSILLSLANDKKSTDPFTRD